MPSDTAIEVRLTETMGRGVFARHPIKRGETLATFHTIRIPSTDVARAKDTVLANYWFEDDRDGAAFLALGYIELINHSPLPNADRTWTATNVGETVTLFALRDIAQGEQLLIDYRFEIAAPRPAWA